MGRGFVLTDYVEWAIARSKFTKLEVGTCARTIPECAGVLPLDRFKS